MAILTPLGIVLTLVHFRVRRAEKVYVYLEITIGVS